jgi:hypothetical protein
VFSDVVRFRDDVGGHQRAAKLLSRGGAGLAEQIFKRDAFVNFHFFVVGIGNAKSFSRHGFQVRDSQRKWRSDRAVDLELCGGSRSLRSCGVGKKKEGRGNQVEKDGSPHSVAHPGLRVVATTFFPA